MKHTIKSLRALNGMTQADLAKLLEVSLPTIIKWEKEPYTMPLGKVFQIAKIMGVEIHEITWIQ